MLSFFLNKHGLVLSELLHCSWLIKPTRSNFKVGTYIAWIHNCGNCQIRQLKWEVVLDRHFWFPVELWELLILIWEFLFLLWVSQLIYNLLLFENRILILFKKKIVFTCMDNNKVSFVVSILRMSTTVNVMLIFIYHFLLYTIYGYIHI